jgi:hypothetical protein
MCISPISRPNVPKEEGFAHFLFLLTLKKYNKCTLEERRKLVRSDAEFEILKRAITKQIGFEQKDVNKIFDSSKKKEFKTPPIPKIPYTTETLLLAHDKLFIEGILHDSYSETYTQCIYCKSLTTKYINPREVFCKSCGRIWQTEID